MKKKIIIAISFFLGIIIIISVAFWFFSRKTNVTPMPRIPTTTIPEVSNPPFIITAPSIVPQQNMRSDAPAEEWQQALEQYKGDEPDFYLMNFATYTGKTFNISYQFKKTPTEHYGFTATLTGSNKAGAKQDVMTWIKSTGLTDAQISTLDIQYVE